ncbi:MULTISPECIES: acyltransferase [unclassified Pseudoalteromonas]|uniref:acyltransferase n=1 Tax=unclassified Pseudoalteromonas TaxID=194690 RepID=UPI001108D213|nr:MULTISPECIES: acyltransferase [unclassified Pseudoalteromonas]TMN77041.1 acyltransferase [Pseudoalteromonas sp. S410]TMN87478.1 acyltransferase [Pseudoalteromonas sp. S408]TMN95555.1 acyltransferase [Pseudoalteromonas sp. S409]TMN98289.1 acyltransferase [Pseudoalteromonas sp. S407]TMO07361.1 acyltransferase [Pseudoalteromonas sp. S186]
MNIKVIKTKYIKLKSKLITWAIKLQGAEIGPGFLIFSNSKFYNHQNLAIGSNVFINDYFWCNAKGGIEIGNDVLIGPNVTIHSSNHNYLKGYVFRKLGHEDRKVIIGSNVWLGANCIILPGVDITDNIVVAAGSVVTKSLKQEGVYGGVPAKYIKSI